MNRLLLILSLATLISCGPSAEEKAKIQKAREDSIRVATESATKLRLETKIALTEKIKETEAIKEGQENRLSLLKAELEVQKDKLNTIKTPQFLRTPQEREQAIKAQVLIIEQAEKDITALQMEINKTAEKIIDLQTELTRYE